MILINRTGRLLLLSIVLTPVLHPPLRAQDRNQSHTFDVRSEGQRTIAQNRGGPLFQGELFEYEFIRFLQEDEREESLLYRPARFVMDETGFFYVEDAGNRRIAVFDADGRYSHSIGRGGHGPGEFQGLRIETVRGGTCTVFDMGLSRASLFRTDGSLIATYPLPLHTLPIGVSQYLIESSDRRIVTAFSSEAFSGTGAQEARARAMIFNAAGDTLWIEQTPGVRPMKTTNIVLDGTSYSLPSFILFGPMPSVVYHPSSGFLLTPGSEPVLDYYHPDGSPRLHVRIDMEPDVVSRSEAAALRRFLERQLEETPDALKPVIRAQLDEVSSRLTKAPWSSAELDDSGYTWLQVPIRSPVPSAADSMRCYRVINPEGEYLGRSTRPKGIHYCVAHGFLLANYAPTGTGEYELAVYRIRPAVRGLTYP